MSESTIDDYKKIDEILALFIKTIRYGEDGTYYLGDADLVEAWKATGMRRLNYNESVYLAQNIRKYIEVDREQDKTILNFVMRNIGGEEGKTLAELMKLAAIGAAILGIILFSQKESQKQSEKN